MILRKSLKFSLGFICWNSFPLQSSLKPLNLSLSFTGPSNVRRASHTFPRRCITHVSLLLSSTRYRFLSNQLPAYTRELKIIIYAFLIGFEWVVNAGIWSIIRGQKDELHPISLHISWSLRLNRKLSEVVSPDARNLCRFTTFECDSTDSLE